MKKGEEEKYIKQQYAVGSQQKKDREKMEKGRNGAMIFILENNFLSVFPS